LNHLGHRPLPYDLACNPRPRQDPRYRSRSIQQRRQRGSIASSLSRRSQIDHDDIFHLQIHRYQFQLRSTATITYTLYDVTYLCCFSDQARSCPTAVSAESLRPTSGFLCMYSYTAHPSAALTTTWKISATDSVIQLTTHRCAQGQEGSSPKDKRKILVGWY